MVQKSFYKKIIKDVHDQYIYEKNRRIWDMDFKKQQSVVEEVEEQIEKDIKIYVNGTFKENIPKSTIVDLPFFVASYARNEGIRNFQIAINGEEVTQDRLKIQKIEPINKIDIDTYDTAR